MSGKVMLSNAGIITMDPAKHQSNSGAVLIESDRISRVGKSTELLEESDESIERIDLRGRWILPGLINTHVHTSQQLGRRQLHQHAAMRDRADSQRGDLLC